MFGINKLVYFGLLILGTICLSNPAIAVNQPTTPIRVGVVMEMPFAQNIDGHYSGIAIDIWKQVALTKHWDYVFIPLNGNINDDLSQLTKQGTLDVVIGPISVTAERLNQMDFTRPFFLSSIGVIARKHELNMFDVLRTFFSKNLLVSVLILLFSFVVYTHLLWYLERGKISGVSTSYFPALRSDMWLQLFKQGFAMPTTSYGRMASLIWIVFAAAMITSINANYTAAMTVSLSQSSSRITSLDDLLSAKVAGVAGQVNSQVAEKNGILVRQVSDFASAMGLLFDGKVDAVVCDEPVGIQYLRAHAASDFVLSSYIFENDELAFAVRLGSPIRHQIDLGITRLQDDDSVVPICRRYIGEDSFRCDL